MIRLYNPGNERECIQKGNLIYQCEQEDILRGYGGFRLSWWRVLKQRWGHCPWSLMERQNDSAWRGSFWGKIPGEAVTRTGDSDVSERNCVGNPVEGWTMLTLSQTSQQEELLHLRSTFVSRSSLPMRQCAVAEALHGKAGRWAVIAFLSRISCVTWGKSLLSWVSVDLFVIW